MVDSYVRCRNKQSHDCYGRESADSYGRHKRHSSSNSHVKSGVPCLPRPAPGDTVFWILCPEAKAGSVIGVGGSIIKALRQETGAKITIAETVPGSDDRVITICAPERDREHDRDRDRARNREGRNRYSESRERDGNRQRDGREANNRSDKDENDILSPAQKALFRVHSRIVEGGTLNGSDEQDRDPSMLITTRLLVPNNQVGCLLGKGGKIIEQMREETKAQIRIFPRDQIPLGTLAPDEIVQIVGDVDTVKNALRIISSQLQENPPHDRGQSTSTFTTIRSSSHHGYRPEDVFVPRMNSSVHHQDANGILQNFPTALSHSKETDSGDFPYSYDPPGGISALSDMDQQLPTVDEEVVFRILCPNDKIGNIIGKEGSIIRSLRDEIGAGIRVADAVVGCDERVVIISAMEHPDENLSPAQEALLHIQNKIVALGPDEDAVITTRLLVPSDQAGCLIGKGGRIISEMRNSTHANIRILGMDDLPKCALANDELVQIVGDIRVSREALIHVTKKIRMNIYEKSLSTSRSVISSSLGAQDGHSIHDPDLSGEAFLPYSGVGSVGHSASCFQSVSCSPGGWAAQDIGSGRSFSDYGNHSLQTGSGSFSRSSGAIVTKATLEVVIPEDAVTAIIVKPGSIAQIRQLSGAKVNLLVVGLGESKRIVEISGTPEQTHAAQCLLQAFILNGQTSPHSCAD